VAELRYKAWGETRYTYGTTPTTYRFTGQREDATIGVYFYNARYYDPALGRFIAPDTLVPEPGNPQSLNRYAYTLNNPLRYTDPTGHRLEEGAGFETDPNYWRDLTLWLVREANYDASLAEVQIIRLNNVVGSSGPPGVGNKALAGYMFIQLVQDSAPWDFKDQIRQNLRSESIRLGSQWFEYSTPGNILFGFNGAAAGFSLQELHVGAGVAQLRDYVVEGGPLGGPETLLDTADDFYAVEFGYRLYQEAYAPDKKVTVSEFNALLVQYEHRDQMALTEAPEPVAEVGTNWPYSPGYFNGPLQPWPPFLFPSFQR